MSSLHELLFLRARVVQYIEDTCPAERDPRSGDALRLVDQQIGEALRGLASPRALPAREAWRR